MYLTKVSHLTGLNVHIFHQRNKRTNVGENYFSHNFSNVTFSTYSHPNELTKDDQKYSGIKNTPWNIILKHVGRPFLSSRKNISRIRRVIDLGSQRERLVRFRSLFRLNATVPLIEKANSPRKSDLEKERRAIPEGLHTSRVVSISRSDSWNRPWGAHTAPPILARPI